MGWDYTPDHGAGGIGGYLRADPELAGMLEARAQGGLAVGRALAPHRTGKLAESGHVEFDGIGGIAHDRMQYSVVFDIDYAAGATWTPDRTAYLDAIKAFVEGA